MIPTKYIKSDSLKCLFVMALAFCWAAALAHAGVPRNIILMISDGAGYNHVDAASLYQYGRTGAQVYEDFPVKLAMSTYSFGGEYNGERAWQDFDYVTRGYTDSAAASTVMSSGVKTCKGSIGVGPLERFHHHQIERYEHAGKMTGLVTSVPLSHATPAGFIVHNFFRSNYELIAREMIGESALDVIMGCGHPYFDGDGRPIRVQPNFVYVGGRELWARLTDDIPGNDPGADADGDGVPDPWTLIQTRGAFQALMTGPAPKRVLGVPQIFGTLQEMRTGNPEAGPFTDPLIRTVPTLAEMARAALNVLDEDPDGFFLMVEGGAVDWASHNNESGRMIEEQIDFNRSVESVVNWIEENSSWDETLLIITADHECGYLWGPGSGVEEPLWRPLVNNGAGNLPGMAWFSGDHTNSLVPFYAKGAGAEGFFQEIIGRDPRRGPYIDNTAIKRVCCPESAVHSKEVQTD